MAARRCVGIGVAARDVVVVIEGSSESLVFDNDGEGHGADAGATDSTPPAAPPS